MLGSEQLEAAKHLADDLELAERRFFARMIRIVGNDLHARRTRRAQHLQALDDDAFERVADGIKPVRRRASCARYRRSRARRRRWSAPCCRRWCRARGAAPGEACNCSRTKLAGNSQPSAFSGSAWRPSLRTSRAGTPPPPRPARVSSSGTWPAAGPNVSSCAGSSRSMSLDSTWLPPVPGYRPHSSICSGE